MKITMQAKNVKSKSENNRQWGGWFKKKIPDGEKGDGDKLGYIVGV